MMPSGAKLFKTCSIFIIILCFVYITYTPMHWPESILRQWLLYKVPYGSQVDLLKKTADKHGWEMSPLQKINEKTLTMLNINGSIGDDYIVTIMGNYWMVLKYDIEAIWVYDSSGKLKIIITKKIWDVP